MERTGDFDAIAADIRAEGREDIITDRVCPSSSAYVLRASELVS